MDLLREGHLNCRIKMHFFKRQWWQGWFYMNLDNGETVFRTWLLYSPLKCAVYCFLCMLFQKTKGKSSFVQPDVFKTWRKLTPRLLDHEKFSSHWTTWKVERIWNATTEIWDNWFCCSDSTTEVIWEIENYIIKNSWLCAVFSQQTLPLHGHSEDLSANDTVEISLKLSSYLPNITQLLINIFTKFSR